MLPVLEEMGSMFCPSWAARPILDFSVRTRNPGRELAILQCNIFYVIEK
jgi:hypothetical protein